MSKGLCLWEAEPDTFSPEMSLQKPLIYRRVWVTMESASFHITCNSCLLSLGLFLFNQRFVKQKGARLSNLFKMSNTGGSGLRGNRTM